MGEPRSDLISSHNPTCDLNLYDGGLSCCGGTDPGTKTRFLLDAGATIPPLVDETYFRWRFYYEEFDAKKIKEVSADAPAPRPPQPLPTARADAARADAALAILSRMAHTLASPSSSHSTAPRWARQPAARACTAAASCCRRRC